VTAGPNRIFTGTVLGDIQVNSRATGEEEPNKAWRQDNTPIEGMMYDYEGKLVYATEFNLVILDKNFKQALKEIRSYEPLRKLFFFSIFSFADIFSKFPLTGFGVFSLMF
jgi:hypothetical protein